ncbi:MAG TPA: glycosyltransferase [Aggregatilineaceae bacterium]|nr:glycosyltransferase [Aggregatilineaceae bacterium]
MDVALITSLYRSERYLARYTAHVLDVGTQIKKAGLELELIIVANDASDEERAVIERLVRTPDFTVRVTYVERETLYASWNRGVRGSSAPVIGFWNVDDVRTAEGIIEGQRIIQQGCLYVYFPADIVRTEKIGKLLRFKRRIHYEALPYERTRFTQTMQGMSFFMFARELYERIGPFDEHFQIAGDMEWSVRAAHDTDFCAATHDGGTFFLHGENLSSINNPRLQVEDNVVHLRWKAWENVRPAKPDLMRACWTEWGGAALPEEMEQKLWGEGAFERWKNWQHAYRRHRLRVQISEILRAVPRWMIDRTGTRPLFARLGIVHSKGEH